MNKDGHNVTEFNYNLIGLTNPHFYHSQKLQLAIMVCDKNYIKL